MNQQQKEVDQLSTDDTVVVNKEKSQGVIRIEALSSSLNSTSLSILLFGIFLVTYSYGLDSQTRSIYQTHATNAFKNHSLISTLNVIKAVAAAVIQPPLSNAANVFGRFELVSFIAVIYVIGTIIEACSKNVETYAGGQVLWVMGLRGFQLLFQIILADVSSLRNRVLFSYIPSLPYLINAWITGPVTSTILTKASWEWGIAMWAIIIPVVTVPIYISLFLANRKAKKQGKLENIKSIYTGKNIKENIVILFWRLDCVGILLITAILFLLLIPLTIAGGVASRWGDADIISMLVIGFMCVPAFMIWESKYAKYHCIPFHLLKNRVVLASLLIGMLFSACWYLQGDHLYTVLRVSFDETIESAARLTQIYSFTNVACGIIAGLIIRYYRKIKWVAVFGTLMYILAFGLMIKYRNTTDNGRIGVIASQVVLGVGGGFFSCPVQAIIQTETKHEHVAIITAIYMTMFRVGGAIGNSISGAIWTNTLPGKLSENFISFADSSGLVSRAYNEPLKFIEMYNMGSPERMAMIAAYDHTQRLLALTGCCMAIPLVLAALTLSNPLIGDEQSLPNAEEDDSSDNKGKVEEYEKENDGTEKTKEYDYDYKEKANITKA
ncbi:unnamed protein product [Cunninghamella echinulata]